jgi:hypothetical protein
MITTEILAGSGFLLFSLLLLLAAHARGQAKDLDALERDMRQLYEWCRDHLPEEEQKRILARLSEAEAELDKLQDHYKRLRGTVARLHRSDVRPDDGEPATAPAPNDEASRFAYKESLRDSARKRGMLR